MHFSIRADTLEKHLQIINEWFDSLDLYFSKKICTWRRTDI